MTLARSPRNALTVSSTGALHDLVYTYRSATHVAIATTHGDVFWGTSISGAYVVNGSGGAALPISGTETDTDWFQALAWSQGSLYALKRNANGNVSLTSPAAFVLGGVIGGAPPTAPPAPEPAPVPGYVDPVVHKQHSLFFEAPDSLWVTSYDADDDTHDFSVSHYVLAGAPPVWAMATGFPLGRASFTYDGRNYLVSSGRGLTGYTDASSGHFVVVYATGTSAAGWLLKLDTATLQWSVLAKACPGTVWHGVALSPGTPVQ